MKGSATMTDINKEYEKEYYDEYRNNYYNPDDDDAEPGINLNWKRIQKGFHSVAAVDQETAETLSGMRANLETLNTDVETLNTDVETLKTNVEEIKTDVDDLNTDVETAEQAAEAAQAAITEMQDNLPFLLNGQAYTILDPSSNLSAKVTTALANHDIVIVPDGAYALDNPISITSDNKVLIILGDMSYSGTDYAIRLYNCRFCKLFVHRLTCNNGTGIKIEAYNSLCQLNVVRTTELYCKCGIEIVASGSTSSGVQHTTIYSNYIRGATYCISMTAEESRWIGEIKLFGGEFNCSNGTGIYTNGYITAIRAFGVSFEQMVHALSLNGDNNECTFYGCRAEQTGTFVFSGTVRNFVFDGPTLKMPVGVDVSGLTAFSGIVFRGLVFSNTGNQIGNEYRLTEAEDGTIIGYATGEKPFTNDYYYVPNQDGEIGGALTSYICPRIARITQVHTYTLSRAYSINAVNELIVYCEKAGITIKNPDATKTLLITTDAQSVWRITPASGNSYFSPSGYLVEKITPYKQA